MRFTFTLCFLFCVLACFAQADKITYYKNSGRQVTIPDSADFIRVVSAPDAGSKLTYVKEFYKNGKPKFVGTATGFEFFSLEGPAVSYFENGHRMSIANYKKGRLVGDSYEYFPNGKPYLFKQYIDNGQYAVPDFKLKAVYDTLGNTTAEDGNGILTIYSEDYSTAMESGPIKKGKRDGLLKGIANPDITFEETYKNGLLIDGTALKDGQTAHYKLRESSPEFIGGTFAFLKYITKNFRIPAADKGKNLSGRVLITFVVERDGKLTDIKVVRSVSPATDEAAVDVIKKSPDWNPAQYFGFTLRTKFTIPVNVDPEE
ncbi:TonB family protein [Inquilinus sp. KBS0705]|nr:TonB family protein [Inquilinus sp. KBS0705]